MPDDFLGLMHCQHKIFSNSTLAWWAAFLGEADGYLILAPKRWYAEADSYQAQILRESWITVDVSMMENLLWGTRTMIASWAAS
jgi:hypothetical protein